MKFQLVSFDVASPFLHDAVAVYCRVWQRQTGDSTVFFKRYAQMDSFVGYVALVEEKVVGLAFGTISQAGQWWHDQVRKRVGNNHNALQNAWVLTELAVLKPYRKCNIGSALHDRVIAEQPHANVLLSTQVDNNNARRFYENRKWSYLHRGFVFQKGRPAYCIMHKAIHHDD